MADILIPDWFKKGIKFTGKWISDTECEIIDFNEVSNLCHVKLMPDKVKAPYRQDWHEDGWNLQHTLWGFEKGEYKLIEDHGNS